ncbi:MAG: PepSY domain-containing protein [Deltaproteobacteria bacterium]|nr:PepSY domain-containing protein [Deltaproteobacteria bacterium]
MNRTLYFLHRWLGLLVAAQLLAWTVGGLLFSLLSLDDVHGDLDRAPRASPATLPSTGLIDVAGVVARAGEPVVRALLAERRGRLVWQLERAEGRPLLVDARDGAPLPAVDRVEAERLALADAPGARGVREATLIERDPPLEYREKPLPAWRVVLEHDKELHLYVDAVTGEVTARRNARWRLYDFFWMLHVMDYRARDDFQHPLLTAFALAGVAASTTGLVVWGVRVARRLRKRSEQPTR